MADARAPKVSWWPALVIVAVGAGLRWWLIAATRSSALFVDMVDLFAIWIADLRDLLPKLAIVAGEGGAAAAFTY